MKRLHDRIFENICKISPDLRNIQTDFIESSTSNSAGMSPDAQITLKSVLKEMYSSTWSPEELKELEGIINVRLIDVINTISTDFISHESYVTALTRPQVAGERHQIERRPRIIQMVPTVHMLGTYVNLKVLDPVVKGSKFAMSGKTANDIRDMNLVLRGTGSGVKCDSADVAGMDTSTYLPQKRLAGVAVNRYLETLRNSNIKYFLGTDIDPTLRIPVEVQYVDEFNNVTTAIEEVSVLEFVQAAELGPLSVTSRLRDGIFQDHVSTSTTVFQSGRFDTSVQHSTLLSTCFELVEEDMLQEHEFIEFVGSVLGDDQFSCLVFQNGLINDVLSDKASALVSEYLNLLGYTVENVNSRYTGELLKLQGVAGAPSPYHSRIATYTSERGDDYNRDVFARMSDINSVLRQLSGRSTNPDHTIIRAFIADMLLGYINTTESIESKLSSPPPGIVNYKLDLDSNLLTYDTYTRYYKVTHKVHIFKGLWFMFPRLMLPPIPVDFGDDDAAQFSTHYHFNSPTKAHYLLSIHKKVVTTPLDAPVPTFGEFMSIVSNPLHPNHQLLLRLKRAYGSQCAYWVYRFSMTHVTNTIDAILDPIKVKDLGIVSIYNIVKALQERPEYVSPKTSPNLHSYITKMNVYLDRRKVMMSLKAADDIKEKYNVSITSDLGYWNRLGQRIIQAIGKKKERDELPDYLFNALSVVLSSTNVAIPTELTNYLSFGDFTIVKKPLSFANLRPIDIHETGFGCAVPPKSIQTLYINTFGLPLIDTVSLHAIKDSIVKETLVEGIQDTIFSVATKIFPKKDGQTKGLELLSTALGLTKKASDDLKRALDRYGSQFFTMPYTFDPSQYFFVNGSYPGVPPNCVHLYYNDSFNIRVQYAILFSLIMTYPHLLKTENSVIYGPYLLRKVTPV